MKYYYQGEVVESVELKGKHTRTDKVLINLPSGEVRDVPTAELKPINKRGDYYYERHDN